MGSRPRARNEGAARRPEAQLTPSLSYGGSTSRSALKMNSPTWPFRANPFPPRSCRFRSAEVTPEAASGPQGRNGAGQGGLVEARGVRSLCARYYASVESLLGKEGFSTPSCKQRAQGCHVLSTAAGGGGEGGHGVCCLRSNKEVSQRGSVPKCPEKLRQGAS